MLLIPAHLAVATVCHLGFIAIYDLLKCYRNIFIRNIFAGIYSMIWLIFYGLVLISHLGWGQTITLRMMVKFLPTFPHLLKSMPFPAIWLYLFLFLLFVCNQIIIAISLKKANTPALFTLKPNMREHITQFRAMPIKKKCLVMSLIFGLLLILAPVGLILKRAIHLYDEPVIVALRGVKSSNVFADSFALEDIQIGKGYTYPDSFNRQNVVVIIVDAMRADHLPMYGYHRETTPFLSELYKAGKLIKVHKTCATCSTSDCGISTIFFGKTWKNVKQKGFTLVSLLKKVGYETHFLLSGYSKDWSEIYDMFLSDVDNFQENPGYPLGDDRSILNALATVNNNKNKPIFMYIHLMSAHAGGIQSPNFQHYTPSKIKLTLPLNYTEMNNYHDNGIMQADDMIRQIFDSLTQKQILQNAQVWIVSDHGESIGEHGYFGHGKNLYEPITHFPLLIYDAQNKPDFYKNTDFARHIDIAPTIVNRLGLPIPYNWEGQSLAVDSIYKYSYHQLANPQFDIFALIAHSDTAIYKLIFNQDFSKIEVYDIQKDSVELHNLVADVKYASVCQQLTQHARASFEKRYIYIPPPEKFRIFN